MMYRHQSTSPEEDSYDPLKDITRDTGYFDPFWNLDRDVLYQEFKEEESYLEYNPWGINPEDF